MKLPSGWRRGRPGAGDEHRGERGQGGEDEEAAPHDPSLRSSRRATGAHRTEKAGLRLSAADRRCRAAGARRRTRPPSRRGRASARRACRGAGCGWRSGSPSAQRPGAGEHPAEHLVADHAGARAPGAAGERDVGRRSAGGRRRGSGRRRGRRPSRWRPAAAASPRPGRGRPGRRPARPMRAVDLGERGRVLGQRAPSRSPASRARAARSSSPRAASTRARPAVAAGVAGRSASAARISRSAPSRSPPPKRSSPSWTRAQARSGLPMAPAAAARRHEADRPRPVALQLQRVGGAAVGGQVGAQLQAALDGGEPCVVAAELDQSVGARSRRAPPASGATARLRRDQSRASAKRWRVRARLPRTSIAPKSPRVGGEGAAGGLVGAW